jgi:hypothetical protein
VQMAQPGTAPLNAVALVTQSGRRRASCRPVRLAALSPRASPLSRSRPMAPALPLPARGAWSTPLRCGTPQMQSFVQRLRPGDQVDVAYANELAVSVEPMQ